MLFHKKTFILFLIVGSIILAAGIWCSSGTLCPYANTHWSPKILSPCNYLVNIDHGDFKETYYMIDGQDKSKWEMSIYLRRILYPLLAYPAMKSLGFEIGGFIVGAIINLLAFISFVFFLKKEMGEKAAIAGVVLLSLNPGVMYWVGLPYAQTLIVPCALWLTIIMFKLKATQNIYTSALWGLVMGVLFTGYDLMVYFTPACFFMFILEKKYKQIPFTIIAMLLPSFLVGLFFYKVYQIPWTNENTEVYPIILKSYFNVSNFKEWAVLIAKVPIFAINHFLFSGFIFLPIGFIATLILLIKNRSFIPLSVIEKSILTAIVLLFLFNEAAPSYSWAKWEMRGFWIARIYQPVFIVFVLYIARVYQTITILKIKKWMSIILIFIAIGNANIVFGQLVKSPISSYSYFLFYKQRGGYDMEMKNLNKYGARPLGVCN